LYYSTLWWEGVPYYYADNAYYRWNGGVGQYETVRPPSQVQSQAAGQSAPVSELIAYPKNGQTSEQQATDKYECHKWAVAQTGFDPIQMGTTPVGAVQGETAAGVAPGRRSDYLRAQAACLDGRGYSVK
jgi:hypothetical protein